MKYVQNFPDIAKNINYSEDKLYIENKLYAYIHNIYIINYLLKYYFFFTGIGVI